MIILQVFHFPFTVVLYHLVLKLVMAFAVRHFYRCFTGKARVEIDWRKSLKKLAPTGIAAGIDIGFSNWGLELVTISLCVFILLSLTVNITKFFFICYLSRSASIRYTMTKSTTIIFILFFAILFGLEKKVILQHIYQFYTHNRP